MTAAPLSSAQLAISQLIFPVSEQTLATTANLFGALQWVPPERLVDAAPGLNIIRDSFVSAGFKASAFGDQVETLHRFFIRGVNPGEVDPQSLKLRLQKTLNGTLRSVRENSPRWEKFKSGALKRAASLFGTGGPRQDPISPEMAKWTTPDLLLRAKDTLTEMKIHFEILAEETGILSEMENINWGGNGVLLMEEIAKSVLALFQQLSFVQTKLNKIERFKDGRGAKQFFEMSARFMEQTEILQNKLALLKVRESWQIPPVTLPKNQTRIGDLWSAVTGYMTALEGEGIYSGTKLDHLLAHVEAGLLKAKREARALSLAREAEGWPSSVAANFKLMRDSSTRIGETADEAKHLFRSVVLPVFTDTSFAPPLLERALTEILLKIGDLSNLLSKWEKTSKNTFNQIAVEGQKSPLFELVKIRGEDLEVWESEAQSLAQAALDQLSLEPKPKEKEKLGNVVEQMRFVRDSLEVFDREYEAIRAELKNPNRSQTAIRRSYFNALQQVTQIKAAMREAKRVVHQKSPARKTRPLQTALNRGLFRAQFTDGMAWINGEPFESIFPSLRWNGDQNPMTMKRRLEKILEALDIPDEERKISEDLAYPPFREDITRRIVHNEPLRKLIKVSGGALTIFDYRFGTAFYLPIRGGWVMEGAQIMVPMFHGGGGRRSKGVSMLQPLFQLRRARQDKTPLGFNTITFDIPPHGHGFQGLAEEMLARFKDMEVYMGWVESVIGYFKYLAGDRMPVVAVGRSHGAKTLSEYAARHSDGEKKLDGIIDISGYLSRWSDATIPSLMERTRLPKDHPERFDPHPIALPIVMAQEGIRLKVGSKDRLSLSSRRDPNQWLSENPLYDDRRRQTPAILFVGDDDQDYRPYKRYVEERIAEGNRLGFPVEVIKSREIQREIDGKVETIRVGGKHDLLAINPEKMEESPEEIAYVYGRVIRFLEERKKQFLDMRGKI